MVGLNHAGWKTLVKTQFIFASADCNHELVLLVNKLECTFCFKRILYCIEQFIVDAVRTAAANCETKCSLEGRWLWFFYLLLYHLLLYEILCAVNCSCKRIHQIFRGSLKVFLSSPSAYRVQFRKKKKKKIKATGACEAEPLEPRIKPEPLDSVDTGRGSSRNPRCFTYWK